MKPSKKVKLTPTTILLVVVITILVVIYLLRNSNDVLELTYLKDFNQTSYNLPIQSAKDAANFFLDQEDIKKELIKQGNWWIEVSHSDKKNSEKLWMFTMGDGDGECGSSYQCYMHIFDDGTIKRSLKCSEGWTCK